MRYHKAMLDPYIMTVMRYHKAMLDPYIFYKQNYRVLTLIFIFNLNVLLGIIQYIVIYIFQIIIIKYFKHSK